MKRPTGWEIAGGVAGSVPIFATLAEAEAWEAKNQGKTALTLEKVEPGHDRADPGCPVRDHGARLCGSVCLWCDG